jgi:epoxyqueuosine reductase
MDLTQRIKDKAMELGFDVAGVAQAGRARHADAFQNWLKRGHHADMAWLARDPIRREDPRHVLPGARALVMVAFRYFMENPPDSIWNDPSRGRVARYAWGRDYHDELLPLLMQLAAFINQEAPGARCRAYVDTGPVLERTWAAEAGLGFIGKHSLLIHPEHGSYLFIGGLLTTAELTPDEPASDDGATAGRGQCGTCRRCLDICPTHAFPAAYIVDSTRCISYLTIENKGAIPESLRPAIGSWIYGCDACQQICPWTRRFARPSNPRFLAFDAERFAPDLMELMTLDAPAFRARYKSTPLVRAKRRGLLRNAAVALGNWGDRAALPALRRALEDDEALVRDHAVWAIRRIEERH